MQLLHEPHKEDAEDEEDKSEVGFFGAFFLVQFRDKV